MLTFYSCAVHEFCSYSEASLGKVLQNRRRNCLLKAPQYSAHRQRTKTIVIELRNIEPSEVRGPVRGGGGGGGRRMDVPRLNFKHCHVTISEGSHVAVAISVKFLDIAVGINFNND